MSKQLIREVLRSGLITENRVKFNFPIPEDIIKIKNVFVNNKFKLYVVGGAVRDALLDKTPKDWDLATDALPDVVEKIMNDSGFRTLATGKSFGVINVFIKDNEYEVATFRSDSKYTDGRRPDSVEFTDIEQDAKRRDLTINALYYDIDTREIVDLVGGINDLNNKVVKTVGLAKDRFDEDRLRILRAIRFAARFNSQPSKEVDEALLNNSSLEGVSPERIRDEFLKGVITSKSTKYFLELLDRYGLIEDIFKGVPRINKIGGIIDEKNPVILIANLLINNPPEHVSKLLNKLTYSSSEVNKVTFLIQFNNFIKSFGLNIEYVYSLKKLQLKSGISDEEVRTFNRINIKGDKIVNAFLNFKLTVNGDQISKELGLSPGPEMGVAIRKMEVDNFKKLLS